jgi:hypothetical protein
MDASNFKEIRNSSRSTGFRDEISFKWHRGNINAGGHYDRVAKTLKMFGWECKVGLW